MSRQKILLPTQNDIVYFVNKMTQYSFNADLLCGSRVVDAKSLLGVLGFGMGRVLVLQVHNDDDKRWMSDLSKYLVANES